MKLDVRNTGAISVLDLSGKLTRGDGDELLRTTVDGLLAGGRGSILINLLEVPYIDSAGIAELIAAFQHAKGAGGTVKLLNPARRVYDVLQLVKLNTIFDIFQDEAKALGSF